MHVHHHSFFHSKDEVIFNLRKEAEMDVRLNQHAIFDVVQDFVNWETLHSLHTNMIHPIY